MKGCWCWWTRWTAIRLDKVDCGGHEDMMLRIMSLMRKMKMVFVKNCEIPAEKVWRLDILIELLQVRD